VSAALHRSDGAGALEGEHDRLAAQLIEKVKKEKVFASVAPDEKWICGRTKTRAAAGRMRNQIRRITEETKASLGGA